VPHSKKPDSATSAAERESGSRTTASSTILYVLIRTNIENEYRMDIAVKCDRCGQVMRFGLHLDTDEYIRLERRLNAIGITDRRVTWRHVYNTFKMHVDINRALELYRTNRIQQAIKEIDALFRRRLI